MTDIVERLRNVFPIGWEGEMRHEAADEIERLRADLAEATDQRNAADFVLALSIEQSTRHSVERDAARAEAARLREALGRIGRVNRDDDDRPSPDLGACIYIARAALAKEPGHE